MSILNNSTQSLYPSKYTTAGDRILLFIIDGVAIGILSFMFYGFLDVFALDYLHVTKYTFSTFETDGYEARYLLRHIMEPPYLQIAVGFAYHFVLEQSSLQGSFAKYLLGWRVYSVNGGPPSRKESALRNLFKGLILVGPIILLGLFSEDLSLFFNFILILFCLIVMSSEPKRRSWADMVSKTVVGK